jgi:hypothetical protein
MNGIENALKRATKRREDAFKMLQAHIAVLATNSAADPPVEAAWAKAILAGAICNETFCDLVVKWRKQVALCKEMST